MEDEGRQADRQEKREGRDEGRKEDEVGDGWEKEEEEEEAQKKDDRQVGGAVFGGVGRIFKSCQSVPQTNGSVSDKNHLSLPWSIQSTRFT